MTTIDPNFVRHWSNKSTLFSHFCPLSERVKLISLLDGHNWTSTERLVLNTRRLNLILLAKKQDNDDNNYNFSTSFIFKWKSPSIVTFNCMLVVLVDFLFFTLVSSVDFSSNSVFIPCSFSFSHYFFILLFGVIILFHSTLSIVSIPTRTGYYSTTMTRLLCRSRIQAVPHDYSVVGKRCRWLRW